jgi:hypothetical protein
MKPISVIDWHKHKNDAATDNSDFRSNIGDADTEATDGPSVISPGNNVFAGPATPPAPLTMPILAPAHAPASDIAPPPESNPTVSKNTTQAGAQITRDNYHWGTTLGAAAGPITFGFRTSATSAYTPADGAAGTFSAFTPQEQAAAVAALGLWASDANITFTNLGPSNNATIEFANYYSSTDDSEAYAYTPASGGADTTAGGYQGDVFINTYYASTTNDSPGTYEFETFIHEIGHSIGMEHPGDYNAGPGQTITYANSAQYIQDSRQYSLMSYFSETETGANFFGTNDETPMLDDVAAVQRLYGANTNDRPGNTTYGFNSNAGSPYAITSSSQAVAYTVYDAGGINTFDFSGYSQGATINLTPESFSSVGGLIDNVTVAQNTKIQDAIGGAGNDLIIANPNLTSTLTGGGGQDTFQSTMHGLAGDTITDIAVGDKINFTDGNLSTFADHLAGTTLTYRQGGAQYSLNLSNDPQGKFVISADATSGVDLTFVSQPSFFVPRDFNGDGETDILWRNTTGDTAIWNSNGAGGFTGQDLGVVDNSWQAAGIADFNGDDKADLLWRNTSGEAAIWDSNSSGGFTAQDLGNLGSVWQVAGTGDFNGDSKADILWSASNGDTAIWNSNGSGGFTGKDLGTGGSGWSVAGTGDFNGDGKADILWSNASGDTAIWNSNGSGGFTAKDLGTGGTGWSVAGTGDFNGDGKADILWSNASGDTAIWDSNGSGGFAGVDLATGGSGWKVAGVGDFNGDGKADILWRNAGGDTAIWDSNGAGGFVGHDLGVVGLNYGIQNV